MITIHLNFENEKDIMKLVDEYPKTINENIKDTFKKVLEEIEKYAKMNAPVDTGRLHQDIRAEFKSSELEGVVFNDVNYSVYVHEGTRKMKARPYILNAIRNRGEIIMERELKKNLLKQKRGLI